MAQGGGTAPPRTPPRLVRSCVQYVCVSEPPGPRCAGRIRPPKGTVLSIERPFRIIRTASQGVRACRRAAELFSTLPDPAGLKTSKNLGKIKVFASWACLGPCWGHHGPSSGDLAPSCVILGPSWGHIGAKLGHLPPSWGHQGAILRPLGAIKDL